jgi:hypothetical protein
LKLRRPRLELVPDPEAFVFAVTLVDDAGAEWRAVGGGATVAEALEFAVASAPDGRYWRPVGWRELYGD